MARFGSGKLIRDESRWKVLQLEAAMTLALMLRAKAEGLPLPAAIAPGFSMVRYDGYGRQLQDERMD